MSDYNDQDDGLTIVFYVVVIFLFVVCRIVGAAVNSEQGNYQRVQQQHRQQRSQQRNQQRQQRRAATGSCANASTGAVASSEYWTPVTEQKLTGIHSSFTTQSREFERKVGRAVENITHELVRVGASYTTTDFYENVQYPPKDGVYGITYKIQNGIDNVLTVQFQLKILFGRTNRGGWGILGVGSARGCARYQGLMAPSGRFFLLEDTQDRHPTIKTISLLEGQYSFRDSAVVGAKWSSIHGDRGVDASLALAAQAVCAESILATDGVTVNLTTDRGSEEGLPVVEAQPVSVSLPVVAASASISAATASATATAVPESVASAAAPVTATVTPLHESVASAQGGGVPAVPVESYGEFIV